MRKMKCMFLLILLALLSGAFVACSDDDDSPESKMYTVTLYTAFGENPVTAKVESGKTLGANMTPSKDGYDFKGWFSVDGTDYTKKAIESDVTLFAYFIKTTTEGSGTATVTTTTNEVGADSYESEKIEKVTTSEDGTKVTETSETVKKVDGTKVETESKVTENSDGTTTSESTVTTKDADGNTTSKVETTVAADGTTTTTTTDAEGKTTTETTGGGGEKLEVSLNETGYPTFEIAIPQGTEKISVYRKKNDEDEYTKILYVYAKVFEIDAYEFTDLYVAKNASYSYYYQIAGWADNSEFKKTSGKSDLIPITNGKLGELEVSVSGGEVNYNEKTGVLTLTTVPTVTSGFSCDLYVDSDIPYSICSGSTYYKTNGDTINLYTHHKGKTLTPYWYIYLREWDSEHHYTGYWYPSEFYGADYGLPESITVPTEISTDTDEADTTLANTSYKSTELKMNGSAAPSGVSETVSFASDGKNCTLTGYYNSTGTYTVSGTSVTVNYTSGDILGTMTGTLTNSNATLTAQGTVTVSGKSVLMYGVFAKQGGGTETVDQSTDAVPANADGTYTVTPYNIAATLAAIVGNGDTEATLIVVSATNDLMSKIPEALRANDGVLVNLDLSRAANLTSLAEKQFRSCESLKSIKLPDELQSIPYQAFSYCTNLKTVFLSSRIPSIGNRSFKNCTALESIAIPESVTRIEENAFDGCEALKEVNYLGTLEKWCEIEFTSGSNPIYYAKSLKINGKTLTTAVIETSTKINAYAFYKCQSLTNVTIGDSVTSIGKYAFYGCSSLESVVLSQNLTEIGLYAFRDCTTLTGTVAVPNGVMTLSDGIFYNCKSLTAVTLGAAVTSIGEYAFYGCSALESVNLPKTLTEINQYAFYNCTALAGTIVLPSGITAIAKNTFYNCKSITGVTIPNSVVSIGDSAFIYCNGITSLEIPDSVTMIGDSAFMADSQETRCLTSVTIGSGVTRIGRHAFANQSNLTTATFTDSESTWYFYSAPQVVPNYDYTGGTEIGKFSAIDTAENATKLKNTYTSGYLYNSNYSAN